MENINNLTEYIKHKIAMSMIEPQKEEAIRENRFDAAVQIDKSNFFDKDSIQKVVDSLIDVVSYYGSINYQITITGIKYMSYDYMFEDKLNVSFPKIADPWIFLEVKKIAR